MRPITTAPMNSLIPDRNDQKNAFLLFLVEAYIGTETAIPSGILWRAIAIASKIPNSILLTVATKVAIPSGILWMNIPRNTNNEVFSNLSW